MGDEVVRDGNRLESGLCWKQHGFRVYPSPATYSPVRSRYGAFCIMKTIYKYIVRSEVEIPKGAILLKIGVQDGNPCLWAEVDTDNSIEVRHFRAIGTGWDIAYFDKQTLAYLDTVFIAQFVWHIYEYIPN